MLDEQRRLEALRAYGVLDTQPEQALDDLTMLAARICEAPIALISLVDGHRQWFKSRVGLEAPETPREFSFCACALQQTELFTVPDATKDARTAGNPLVTGEPGIRFYAGAPLVTAEGAVLGTLCVIDRVPRRLSASQEESLRVLARQVMSHFEFRRQAHELGASERRLRTIFENEPECVKLLGAHCTLLEMNPAGLRMIEADSLSQVVGQSILDMILPEYRAPFAELMARVMRGGSGMLEFEILGIKGTRLWLETNAAPMRDERGEITSLLGITRDITARKQAEEELRLSSARFAAVFRSNPAAIGINTLVTGRFLDVNAQVEKFFGWTRAEMIGKTVFELGIWVDPAQREPLIAQVQAMGSVRDAEVRLRRRNGEVRDVLLCMERIDVPGETEPVLVVMFTDLTERKRAVQHIRQLNRTYMVLSEINQLIVRERDPQKLLADACLTAVEKGGFQMAWIGMVDWTGERVQIAAHAGASEQTLERLAAIIISTQSGVGCAFTKRSLTAGEHAVCNDIENDPSAGCWRDAALRRDYRSMVALPLKAGNQTVGTFNLYSSEAGFFDAHELRLLDELAADIGFALEISERETERQRAEEKVHAQLDELLRWQNVMIAREERVQQLKAEVNAILTEQGGPARYPSQSHP